MTVGFLHGQSAYEPEPVAQLDYVELGFKRFSRNRGRLRSAGICGACCPIRCPSARSQAAAATTVDLNSATSAAIRSAASSGGSCSQTRSTRQPAASSFSVVSSSR